MIEESLAGTEEYIVDAGFDLLGEGAVAADTQFQVRAVVANHIYLCRRQFVAILFVHPALHGLHDLGVEETVDVVVAPGVSAIGAEVPYITHSLEGHAEVVALGVHGESEILDLPAFVDEDVEAAEAGMTVGGEIEVAVGTEGGEHLVARGVDGLTEVLYTARLIAADEAAAPDVESSQTAGHVADEVQPFAVRGYGGMGETGERVF